MQGYLIKLISMMSGLESRTYLKGLFNIVTVKTGTVLFIHNVTQFIIPISNLINIFFTVSHIKSIFTHFSLLFDMQKHM